MPNLLHKIGTCCNAPGSSPSGARRTPLASSADSCFITAGPVSCGAGCGGLKFGRGDARRASAQCMAHMAAYLFAIYRRKRHVRTAFLKENARRRRGEPATMTFLTFLVEKHGERPLMKPWSSLGKDASR